MNNALSVFPEKLKAALKKACGCSPTVYEIHLLSGRSVYLSTSAGIRFITRRGSFVLSPPEDCMLIPEKAELEEITNRAIGYSGFAHEKELEKGFITYAGGCRMGICAFGGAGLNGYGEINSLCIRIPAKNENINFPTEISSLLLSFSQGLLIAGPPASGKTTLLRYIAKKISEGAMGGYKKVCVIDERMELSGSEYTDFSLGPCCHVLAGKEKSLAIQQALRVLSPQIIICDEIGSVNESEAILEGLNSGVLFISSIHAADIKQLVRRKQFRKLFDENVFDKFVFLSSEHPGKTQAIYGYTEVRDEIRRSFGVVSGS